MPFPPARPAARKRHFGTRGKRVVFVTPYLPSAKEEAEKHSKRGLKIEIKRDHDDAGKVVYVVYVFEGGYL